MVVLKGRLTCFFVTARSKRKLAEEKGLIGKPANKFDSGSAKAFVVCPINLNTYDKMDIELILNSYPKEESLWNVVCEEYKNKKVKQPNIICESNISG